MKIYNDYKDHADFLTVYVREAHPTDEWQMKSNVKEDVCYAQPKTLEQRIAIANDFVQRLNYPVPFGIDDMTQRCERRLFRVARTHLHHRRTRPHRLRRRHGSIQLPSGRGA